MCEWSASQVAAGSIFITTAHVRDYFAVNLHLFENTQRLKEYMHVFRRRLKKKKNNITHEKKGDGIWREKKNNITKQWNDENGKILPVTGIELKMNKLNFNILPYLFEKKEEKKYPLETCICDIADALSWVDKNASFHT